MSRRDFDMIQEEQDRLLQRHNKILQEMHVKEEQFRKRYDLHMLSRLC